MTSKEITKINSEIAQFKEAISEISYDNENIYDLEWIFKKSNSCDKKVLPTKYIISNHRELIGDTALSIALKDHNVFKTILNKKIGLDYNSYYISDEFDENPIRFSTIVQDQYKSLNIFSDPRYKLPNLLIRSILNVYRSSKNFANLSDKNGTSPFHVACMANYSEVVAFYLDNKISIDHAVNHDSPYFPGYTPLHFAVKCCSVQTVEILLQRNANLQLKDAKGMTALHILLKNYVEFADTAQKRIASNPPDDDLNMYVLDMSDDQPCMLAKDCCAEDYLKLKCADMIRLFLKKYSHKNMLLIDELGFSYFHLIGIIADLSLINSKSITCINYCINMESPLWPGYSPLHLVALLHDIHTVREFIEKGADMGIKDVKGVTPIDICISRYQSSRYKVKYIHSLLSLQPMWKNIVLSDGKTRLLDFVFAMKPKYNFKRFLKELPNDIDIYVPHDSPLWPGFSIMHLALLFSKNYEITKDIFNHNPKSLYAQNSYVSNPLDFAFRKKKKAAVGALLFLYNKLKDFVDDASDQQLSCLHVACAVGHYNSVKKLLSSGNNANVVYNGKPFGSVNSGWTPLHFAVANNKYPIVETLAQHGANFFAKDINGMTPVHLLIVFHKNGEDHDENKDLDNLFSLSNYKDAVADDIGLSHLHVACFRGLQDAVRELVNRGADVNRVINYKPEANNQSIILSGLTKFHGSTPLDLALREGNDEIVKFLLELGADVFTKSYEPGKFVICNILENECIGDSNELYLPVLVKSGELQKQIEQKIGLTKLHIACRMLDLELAKELLDNGADINAQIHMNSPVWPGYTPLHTLDYSADRHQELTKVQELLKLLLDRKADVMLSNAEKKTPLHVAYKYCHSLSEFSNYSNVNTLLKAQRDFNVNPKSIEDITHFHMACGLNNIFVVKKFLARAEIDVNQPIGYFVDEHYRELAGCTPLHLAVSKRTSNELTVRLEIVDLLLTYGADVHAKDVYGNSPLHKAVERNEKCQDLLERLARGGADLNCRNIFGKTPLENLITKRSEIYSETLVLTAEEIRFFLKCGCHFNDYNPATGKGYLALALSCMPYQDMKNLIAGVGINYPDSMNAKYKGRTPIHNIVSAKVPDISVSEYADLIDQLSKFDCHIDDQDESGQTALHLAVHHQNANAVKALISVGADMSMRDFSGKAAFNYNPGSCSQCDFKEDSEDENEDDDLKCDHVEIHYAFRSYGVKLQLCGSYAKLFGEFTGDERSLAFDLDLHNLLKEDFFVQVKKIQSLKIGSSFATFGDFLSDTGAVINYSTMSTITREEIDDFFSSNDILRFRDEFWAVSDIINFQYKKAVKRRNLMEESKKVLVTLTGYCLPDLCSQFVLQYLTNTDFENLIVSVA